MHKWTQKELFSLPKRQTAFLNPISINFKVALFLTFVGKIPTFWNFQPEIPNDWHTNNKPFPPKGITKQIKLKLEIN